MNSRITIVIPVFNEEINIESVIKGVERYANNIIVVDDFSSDNSLQIIRNLENQSPKKITVLINKKNRGIGYSVKKGFLKSLEFENDIVIKFDGDNQHRPDDIPKFVTKIIEEKSDFVKGNRFLISEFSKPMPNLKIIGNLITTNLQKIVSGNYNISDPNNGFLAIKKKVLKQIDFKNLKNNYYFENSLLICISSLGLKIGEIPIKTIYADEKSSIPILNASLKLIPTFIRFFYLRNILNAKYNLSINALVFFAFNFLIVINIFFNNPYIWITCLLLFLIYLIIDILNFFLKHNESKI